MNIQYYLGKNDHLATINNVEILQGEKFLEDESEINSLFMKKYKWVFKEKMVLGALKIKED